MMMQCSMEHGKMSAPSAMVLNYSTAPAFWLTGGCGGVRHYAVLLRVPVSGVDGDQPY
jgi:hypothetical protein